MIDKLELILALARERHFGRAAESVGITQPTLSAGLRQLEDQLGILIVERDSRFRGFTPEGERVLGWARRIVGDTRAMRQEIDAHRRDVAGHLRLAVIPTAVPLVALLTAPMLRRHPALRFTVLSRASNQVLELMENLEVDAGVTYLDADTLRRVASVPLYREHFHLVTTADGPFAGRDSVTWAEARVLPLCLLTPDMQNRRIIDEALAAAGVEATSGAGVGLHADAAGASAHRAVGQHPARSMARDHRPGQRLAGDPAGIAGTGEHGGPGGAKP